MTVKDKQNIRRLYYMHRYSYASIAKLYGVSRQRITEIILEITSVTFSADDECIICSNDNAQGYFIDGNENNDNPQNIIKLCEPDKRLFQRLQIRRKSGILKSQLEP